jgi:hypothetical protein
VANERRERHAARAALGFQIIPGDRDALKDDPQPAQLARVLKPRSECGGNFITNFARRFMGE